MGWLLDVLDAGLRKFGIGVAIPFQWTGKDDMDDTPSAALALYRQEFTDLSTIGSLSMDGVFVCYTLEPSCRKQPGQYLCIPQGTYEIRMQSSTRFQMQTPHLVTLQDGKYVDEIAGGRTMIEIHPGNTTKDTSGCILVGQTRDTNFIGNSRDAFAVLVPKIEAKLAQGRLFIAVTGGGAQI